MKLVLKLIITFLLVSSNALHSQTQENPSSANTKPAAVAENSPITAKDNSNVNAEKAQPASNPENGNQTTTPAKKKKLTEGEIDWEQIGDTNTNDLSKEENVSWAYRILKTTVILALMIGVFLVGWKFLVFKKGFNPGGSEVIKTLYQHNMGPGKSLQIIEMGGRLLIMGLSDAGLQLITEITDKSTIEKIKMDCDKDSEKERPDFWIELSKSMANKMKSTMSNNRNSSNTRRFETTEQQPWENTRSRSKETLSKIKQSRDLFHQEDK